MFNVSLSEGTICSMIKKCALKVKPVVQKIRECLIDSDVVNFDETGVRVESSTQWVHNSSNEKIHVPYCKSKKRQNRYRR